ncbi:phage major capsid protein [Nocardia cyriacigeorgica]|uniref:phage major capsid protein n=1 Tax=Nocardia cyriacigeorgica TaxID=135487 RepID=UPI002455FFDA|nr:phage major capsid protein [Nocardia cyriacigeorgica]
MATETTNTSAKAWAPDITTFAPTDAVPDALILETSTIAGAVEGDAPVVRVAYVDDDEAQFTAEGAEIPEADPGLSEALVHTAKVTQLVRLSREQYSQAGTELQLAESVRRAVTKKANAAYLAQVAPTAPAVAPVAGLVNVAGVVAGDPVSGSLDALIDLIAELQANDAMPTHLILDPVGWAELRKLKTATGSNQSLLGAGTSDAQALLLSLPTLVSNAMPANTGLVVDKTAVISAVGQVLVATSTDAYFASDSVGLRATWRFGHVVPRPNRLGKFTVGTV